jgi:Arc/MetJ-type ribon-helix-helix transcriptional regulator
MTDTKEPSSRAAPDTTYDSSLCVPKYRLASTGSATFRTWRCPLTASASCLPSFRVTAPRICDKRLYHESENREPAMQLNLPPDLETLIQKRLSSGAYTNAEDVLRRALEAQDAEESWTDEERSAYPPTSRKAIGKPNAAS